MAVEVLVLRRKEGIDDELRHSLNGQIEAPLLGVFRQKRAIARMDARHHGRLVIAKLRIVRQIARKMPNHRRDRGDTDQEHDRASRE